MSSLIRIGIKRILSNSGIIQANHDFLFIRTITSKTTRAGENRPPRPKPWPYNEKHFNHFYQIFERTSFRFDDNTKLLVVEGPVAAGKSEFAKQLATELDMLYLPEANLDMFYINSYGYDLRKLDPQLPESCKSFDVMDFLKNPRHFRTAKFQIEQYMVKFSQYIDALAHIFNTGQGVVLDRCPYSDFVFAEAMYKFGYITKKAYKKYYEVRDNTISELMKPHLVIYLDVPVPKVIDNIKQRAIPWEKDSTVLTPEYLKTMEEHYKQSYLKDISAHSELLVYDWTEKGDVEIVVEDVERIKFEYDYQDKHMQDWKFHAEEDYDVTRYRYSARKDEIMQYFQMVPYFDVPELLSEAMEAKLYYEVLEQAPGQKYQKGYNTDMGDSGYIFKSKTLVRQTLPLIERRKSL